MDPISAGASIYGVVEAVATVGKFIHRIQKDIRNAPVEVEEARNHVLLLQKEIGDLRSLKALMDNDKDNPFGMTRESFTQAIATAENLLSDIELSVPVDTAPETMRKRLRWALKDKDTVKKLAVRLHETESSLQTILQLEQNRITRSMWSVLLQQSIALSRIENQQAAQHQQFNALIFPDQENPRAASGTVQVEINEIEFATKRKAVPLSPKRTRLDRGGFSALLVLLPRGDGTSYSLSLQLAMFSKMYSAEFRVCWPTFTFERMMRTQNIVSTESEIVQACKTGDFRLVQSLFASGQAHPNDITESMWPLLDYAIEGRSSRVVRLLLDNGSDPNLTYDQSDMSPLQAAFMRGHLDIARDLIKAGADIEHIDSDGFSILSYLWVVEEPLPIAADFLRLCSAHSFEAVNATDDRGWSPFHRAAAIGTAGDVETFIKLGASVSLRTQWYGWTPLFFAASHDNVETFEALVRHSGPHVYQLVDGDGWTLLHCCVYFGAKRVMKIVLERGIDINQKTEPAPMLEDPELAYLELTARDIALYMGPERYGMYTDALSSTGFNSVLEEWPDLYWDADGTVVSDQSSDSGLSGVTSVYGAEDVDDRWTILHWASYCGSPKIMRLLLIKGANPKQLNGITAYLPPSLDDLEKAPATAEYIHGSVHRPFVSASSAVSEIE